MKIATWNINSIRVREQRLLEWLDRHQVDALCLQETKVVDDQFPREGIEDRGYHVAFYGQKTYNGVAIISKTPPENIIFGMGEGDEDEHKRLISADIDGVRVIGGYFPNGRQVGADSYAYKLDWMRRLRTFLGDSTSPDQPVALVGDFNVAPFDTDAKEPDKWADSVLCHEDARNALENIKEWGFTDVFHKHHPEGGIYTWWDYRMLAFPKNNGLRIDHIYATESLAARSVGVEVDRQERKKGTIEKPSDHAPVIAEFS